MSIFVFNFFYDFSLSYRVMEWQSAKIGVRHEKFSSEIIVAIFNGLFEFFLLNLTEPLASLHTDCTRLCLACLPFLTCGCLFWFKHISLSWILQFNFWVKSLWILIKFPMIGFIKHARLLVSDDCESIIVNFLEFCANLLRVCIEDSRKLLVLCCCAINATNSAVISDEREWKWKIDLANLQCVISVQLPHLETSNNSSTNC